MKPHEERVVAEKSELDVRLEKLDAFLETEAFADLDRIQKKLLFEQRNVMRRYSEILGSRIATFKD